MQDESTDLVATWTVPMSDKVYKVEFEHGTTTGKRVIRVNGKEVLRRDWMFKLVGKEFFELNKTRCAITIEAVGIFTYEYSLQVGNKTYESFREQQKKQLQVWYVRAGEEAFRVCLEKDTMEIWINGAKVDTTGEFLEDGGTRTHFEISPKFASYIMSESSGKRNIGLVHYLYVNDQKVSENEDGNVE